MAEEKRDKLVLENAKIIFRNFSGQPSQYNEEGARNFCVLLDTPLAMELKEEGWNIRWAEGRQEGDLPQAYMSVAVSYKNTPPTIVQITKNGKVMLKEEDLKNLDWAEIKTSDLIIRPYSWEVNKKTGIKAYLKSLYVVLEEDEFEAKYSTPKEDREEY